MQVSLKVSKLKTKDTCCYKYEKIDYYNSLLID